MAVKPQKFQEVGNHPRPGIASRDAPPPPPTSGTPAFKSG